MHNPTEASKNTNATNPNKPANKIQRISRSVLSSAAELNFNTPKLNSLKSKLETNTTSLNVNSEKKKIPFPLINNNKSPILIKDKMGNLPGYGLWCQDVSGKVPAYNRNETLEIIKSDIYSKNNVADFITEGADKKTIELLKDKVADLVTKLEEALAKFYESEYRTQRAENLKEDYYEIIQNKIAENQAIFEAMEPLNNQISSLTEALNNAKKEIERLNVENGRLLQQITEKLGIIEEENARNEKFKKKNSELEAENEKIKHRLTEQTERIEIMQLSLDRYQSKVDNKDLNTPNNADSNLNSGNNNASHGNVNSMNSKLQSEEILRMQLQIVDLKKRLSEDEKIRMNLFEVIKAKKAKNKTLKDEITKVVSVFEESGKENKWSQDLIMQKDSIIKVLKDKINSLNNEIKALNKKYAKFMNRMNTEEKAVEVNLPFEQFIQVKASPNVFYLKNNQII